MTAASSLRPLRPSRRPHLPRLRPLARLPRLPLFLVFLFLLPLTTRAEDYLFLNRTSPPTAQPISLLATAGDRLFALSTAGTLFSTSDGNTWTPAAAPTTANLTGIVRHAGRYVAIDTDGGVFASTDALQWTRLADALEPAHYGPFALATDGQTLACAASGGYVWTSADGVTWKKLLKADGTEVVATTGYQSASPRFLVYLDHRFLLAAPDGLYTSTDAATWTRTAPTSFVLFSSIAGGDGHYVASRGDAGFNYSDGSGNPIPTGGYFQSSDGTTWTSLATPALADVSFVNGFFYAREAVTDALLRSTDGGVWTTVAARAPLASLLGAVSFQNRFFTLSRGTPAQLYTSADGATWTSLHQTTALTAADGVAHGNGLYVAGGLLSTDGVSWSPGAFTSPVPGAKVRPLFCHDRFFFIETIPASSDGNIPETANLYSSLDGRTAVKIKTYTGPGAAAASSATVAYGNGRYLISTTLGTLLSTDGTQWTEGPAVGSVAFGAGLFVATHGTTLSTSPEGVTWTTRATLPPSQYNLYPKYSFGPVIFARDRFVALKLRSSKAFEGFSWAGFTSTDGVHWQEGPETIGWSTYGPAFAGGVFILRSSGTDSTTSSREYIFTSLDGLVWQPTPAHAPGLVSFAGADGLLVATDNTDLFSVALAVPPAPTLTSTTLAPATLRRADTTTLAVSVSSATPVSYQWRRDGVPLPGAFTATLTLSGATARSGDYDVVIENLGGQIISPTVHLTVADAWLANVSSRAWVGTGEDALIQGFVLRSARDTTLVLARAIGPTLADYGVNDVLANPYLELHRAGETAEIAHNDNWRDNGFASYYQTLFSSLGAFTLPETSNDAALSLSLGSGVYSFPVTGVLGGTGIALSELYDASDLGRIVNLSARARVGSGDKILIAGFVISGTQPLKVLIRGVGPTLAKYGVDHPLNNPKITLYNAAGEELHNNDQWSDARNLADLRAASTATGAFALADGSNDAAMLETLAPGVYTVHVTSVDGTSGVALAEIYEAP